MNDGPTVQHMMTDNLESEIGDIYLETLPVSLMLLLVCYLSVNVRRDSLYYVCRFNGRRSYMKSDKAPWYKGWKANITPYGYAAVT